MIGRGAAWVYRDYAKDPSLYRLENEAKAAKRGLWGLPEAQRMPPLGMATWRSGESRARAGCKRASRFRFRWVQLRRQAVLPPDDLLRRGEVLSDPVRRHDAGRQSRRDALRDAVPVTTARRSGHGDSSRSSPPSSAPPTHTRPRPLARAGTGAVRRGGCGFHNRIPAFPPAGGGREWCRPRPAGLWSTRRRPPRSGSAQRPPRRKWRLN